MRRIAAKDIEDGMVLALEVVNNRGEALLNIGDRLRKTYAAKLEAWGVQEVVVEGETAAPASSAPGAATASPRPEEGPATLPQEMEERIVARISHRFADVIEDPVMRGLMEISTKHVLARAAKRYGVK